MTTPSQRQVFLEGEGDAWFQRNRQADPNQVAHWIDQDPLAELLENLPLPRGPEVGLPRFCGQVVRSHAMTLRLSIDDQPDQIKTPVHGAAKARGH